MRGLVVGISVVVAVGCYDARKSCEYTCVSSNACPDGLQCQAGHCVTSASETCNGNGGDGSNGGSDGSGGNGWRFVPINIDLADPYVANPTPPDWAIGSTMTYDTDNPSTMGAPPAAVKVLDPAGLSISVVWLRAGHFAVQPTATLIIRGTRPLIVIANTATIQGQILAQSGIASTAAPSLCGTYVATNGVSCGAGGPGGGFNGFGGRSGSCPAATASSGGQTNGDDRLEPLRGGCNGASGGTSGGANGGPGGIAGGALQISARDSFDMEGAVAALIAGGGHGTNGASAGGGGGGGTGGGIVVETDAMTLSGTICANGGGGGEGDGAPAAGMPVAATAGCDPQASGAGASGSLDGGDGGSGGGVSQISGFNGGAGSGSSAGGGGGGGAAGRIRLRSRTKTGTAVTSPSPRVDVLP
jgi:hypothetical protein